MKKNLFIIPLTLLAIAGCNINTTTPITTTSETTSSSEPMIIIDLPSDEIITTKGNQGGYMTDINVGSKLPTNHTYLCTFTPSLLNTTINVVSGNSDIATIEMVEKNSFNIITKKAGDFILTIFDSNSMIAYNNVVSVRNPYTADEILEKVYEQDPFVSSGLLGAYKFAVSNYNGKNGTGVISGHELEESTTTKSVFSMSYGGISGGVYDNIWYWYECSVDNSQSTLDFNIVEVNISMCGDRATVFYGTDYELFEIFYL